MNNAATQHYTTGEMTITVRQSINEDVFRAVETMLATPLGRFKDWSELFVFTPDSVTICERIAEYLRRSNIAHSVEIERVWAA